MSKLEFNLKSELSLNEFLGVIFGDRTISQGSDSIQKLSECRAFIENLLDSKARVYGITTGVGDLRKININARSSNDLSINLIRSHDAGIGKPFSNDITLGAMVLCANSLSKGYSGFSPESLNTLISMINAKIIPEIPSSGSLGASGDLAFLARLGRAMLGDDVPVWYQGERISAGKALELAKISRFSPKAKEGLALINGTAFMTSMLALSFHKELLLLDNLMALQGLFLNAIGAIESAFYPQVHQARNQEGQKYIASLLLRLLQPDDRNYEHEFQNDYCIRCIPQIFGPRIETILEQQKKIEAELNAITDNPLIFRQSDNIANSHSTFIREFKGEKWGIFSGGNFHGENLTVIADIIALSNAKVAITLERQLAYLLNPSRNGNKLPCYLIADPNELGLKSGFMIPHYTANALVHKINLLAQPSSLMNATSANESEDVVSYGATACQKLTKQLEYFSELLVLYGITVVQAYSITRKNLSSKHEVIEELFSVFNSHLLFPTGCEDGFGKKYEIIEKIINSRKLSDVIKNPLLSRIKQEPDFAKEEFKYVNC